RAGDRPVSADDRPGSWTGTGWRRADAAVAAGILLILGGLLSPAILANREQARTMACQDHLRQFGVALPAWAGRVQGWLPHIPATGNTAVAGFYGPQLVTAGLVRDHGTFVCPSSALAREQETFRIPNTLVVYLAQGARLVDLQARMGGSYNYGLGFVRNGHLVGRQLSGQRFSAIMSDRPAEALKAEGHRNGGVNVLFQDGHVKFVILRPMPEPGTPPSRAASGLDWRELFISDRGLIEAGRSAEDIVLAPSWARPIPPEFADLFSPERLSGAIEFRWDFGPVDPRAFGGRSSTGTWISDPLWMRWN
ncbi:MAG TPA: H-X9-DG-CTERM domain-containing protein, partial [Pirellulaceae bacterium]